MALRNIQFTYLSCFVTSIIYMEEIVLHDAVPT